MILLSQLDRRYYGDVAGRATWSMDFTLVKEGEEELTSDSGHSDQPSVHLEVDLDQIHSSMSGLDRNLRCVPACEKILLAGWLMNEYVGT